MGVKGIVLTLVLIMLALAGSVEAQKIQQIGVEEIRPNSLFGESISIDGSYMIVGARWDNDRSNNAGAAYVFVRESSDLWDQVVKLTANDGANSDYFGSDVDLSGDWAVVGASGFSRRRGSAYVFQRSGDNWVQRKKLVPGSNSDRSVFGASVTIDGGFIAVGAPDHIRSGDVRSGGVYVYALNSGSWTQHAFIRPGDTGSVDYLGTTVALRGNLLAIAATGDGRLRGSVYIYRRDGSRWVQQQKIIPSDARNGDGFGTSISMDDNWLAIGAPHDDISVSNQGSVYLYKRNGNSFVFESKVKAADPRVSQSFGFSVAINETDLLVGAPGDRRGAGSAYRFERDGSGNWRQQVKFQSEIENRRAAFGHAVSIGAADMVMGATGEVQAQLQARSGAVFSLGGGGILRQGFQDIEASFRGVLFPDLKFADVEGDGDLDLALYGLVGGNPRLLLYTNEGDNTFKKSSVTFDVPADGSVGWIDIDNNGTMDLVAAGDFSGALRVDVYFNNGDGAFSKVDLGIPGFANPNLSWADFDSDGDQDLLIGGVNENGESSVLLLRHQPGHSFEPVDAGIGSLEKATFEWGDYDNDGDPDILISGFENDAPVAFVYKNRPDDFIRKDFALPGIAGTVKWVDFTSDGLLDIFLCGDSGGGDVKAVLLKNESETSFVDIGADLPALKYCSGSWGDYDNDGDDDLALSGSEFGTAITDVYENVGGKAFEESRFKLTRVSAGAVEWVDFDRDGRLDLAVAGRSDEGLVVQIYRNSVGFTPNQVPHVPGSLKAEFNGNNVVLRWGAGKDEQTATAALTYNLRVGSSPGGIDVLAPNTTRNGFRALSTGGNVGHNRRFVLSGLSDGIYYWSIQAVDDAFGASEFAPEGSFIVGQSAQDFHDINAAITGVTGGASQWVDFRRTGFLDILLTGRNDRGPFSAMYRYRPKAGTFVKTTITFPDIAASAAAFGDYDNDSDMDLALIGESENGLIAKIYRNDRSDRITDISAPLVPVSDGSVAWGDLDNDGDNDLVLIGHDGNSRVAVVYANNRHDEFVPAPVSFVRLSQGSIDIGDFDGDSDNDVLLTGFDGTTPRSILYRNDGFPRFSRASASFVGVRHGQGSFGDFDGDGDLDILISGQGLDGPTTTLYENRGSEMFVAMETPLPDLEYSSVSWGDYDNNGKMDILLSGSTGGSNVAAVYRYMGSKDGFQILHIVDLPATKKGGVSAGDFDRDGRLDMLVAGEGGFFPTSRVIQNQVAQWKNSPPSRPTGLSYRTEGNKLHLFWQASQDAETPSSSLSYDLRVSSKHSGADIMAPNTLPNGTRLSVTRGNVGHNRRWTIIDPPAGRITVSVHAVDGGFLASQSSDKLTLEIGDDQSSFTTSDSPLPGIEYGDATWIDLDKDGDLDISVVGGAVQEEISKQFLNDGHGEFVEIDVAIPAVAHATTVWGDYDGDGDDDLFINGETEHGMVAYVLRNDSGLVFIDIQAPVTPVRDAAASWADIDGDGDDDLIVSGNGDLGPESTVYRNRGADTFFKTSVLLPGVFKGSHDWADFDGDGDLDLLLTGSDGTFPSTRLLKNRGSSKFIEVDLGLVDVFDGTADWVDIDGDNDFDITITGHALAGVVAKTYVNTGGESFFELANGFPGVRISSTSWGDFDNDGDLDLAVAGWDGLARLTKVFENSGNGTFVETFTTMVGVSVGSVEWGDADGDGDLDLLVAGASGEAPTTNVYLFDATLGSGKGGTNKVSTSSETMLGANEFPLTENGFLFKQSYPNPFASLSTAHFAVGRSQRVQITLYNVIGQVVDIPFEGTVQANEMVTAQIDAAGIASGAYFLRIEGETFADTQTVIVNK